MPIRAYDTDIPSFCPMTALLIHPPAFPRQGSMITQVATLGLASTDFDFEGCFLQAADRWNFSRVLYPEDG